MGVYLFVLLLAPLAAFDEQDLSSEYKDLDAPLHTVVMLPCDAGHKWYASGVELEEDEYHKILPNGSLWIQVRMEDMEYVYQCEIEVKLSDGTIKTTKFNYHINPLDAAFLARGVENVTIDWGTLYTFPCSFSGAFPRTDSMLLNGKVVTDLQHNITEDSVVECRVSNDLGDEHSVAFITIRPGSKERALKDGISSGPHCRPYHQLLPNSSVCFRFLTEVTNSSAESDYLIARSRLYDYDHTNDELTRLFSSWDELLLLKQINASSSSTQTFNQSETHKISFTSWRCLDWAKRLTCVLSYPRCQNVAGYPIDMKHVNQLYVEKPVCRSHCLAITGLFCLAPLEASLDTFALDPLLLETFNADSNTITAWDQLLKLAQTQLNALPGSLTDFHEGRSNLNVLRTCDSNPTSTLVDCTLLPLEKRFSAPTSLAKLPIIVNEPVDLSTGQCVDETGLNYRGTVTNPTCLPWDVVRNQQFASSTKTWPGLLAMTSQSFPLTLDDEAISAPVCRNPAGLAPYPFCLSLLSPNGTFNNHSSAIDHLAVWKVTPCTDIPKCPPIDSALQMHSATTAPDASAVLFLSATKIQIIVTCVLLICLFCFILTVYAVWRANRCGIHSLSSSSLCLSALEFTEFGVEKDEIKTGQYTLDEKTSRFCHRFSDTQSEQVYLQHRLLWIKRRRRLRQLNGVAQCALGCWYVTVDFLTCRRKPPEPGPTTGVVTASGEEASQPPDLFLRSATDIRYKNYKFNRGWCPLFQRLFAFKRHRGRKASILYKKPCSKIRRLGIPLQNREDDEFEEKALGLQLHKPVAYVANVTNTSSRKLSGLTVTLRNSCGNCSQPEQSSPQLCEACQIKYEGNNEHFMVADCAMSPPPSYSIAELIPLNCGEQDPGLSLTESSLQLISSGPTDLGWNLTLEKLFNMASMTHLLHPKLKQVCYPRQKLVELQRLAKRAFGWIILAYAPNLHNLVRRHRLLSVTSAEQLGLTLTADREEDRRSVDSPSDDSMQDPLVVIKMLANDASLETEANFLREAEVLIELSHKNIVQLLGVCLPLKPLSLLLEYMPFGDLTTFLKQYEQSNEDSRIFPQHLAPTLMSAMNGQVISRTPARSDVPRPTDLRATHKHSWLPPIKLTLTNLLEMALDACDAMVYLSDNYYVHRDVATRSFLVGNKMVIKLADFSMCRPVKPGVDFVAVEGVYLPVKWLPLESILEGLFQIDTDVWSYGVFLWELLSYASEPYSDLSHEQVITFLEQGGRLSSPANCPATLYNLMLSCWDSERNQRPSFPQIRLRLHEILDQVSNPS